MLELGIGLLDNSIGLVQEIVPIGKYHIIFVMYKVMPLTVYSGESNSTKFSWL